MNSSPTVSKLAMALADAHRAMPTLTKDGVNPHFKSRYLTLDGLLGAVRGPLLANGILLIQSANDSDDAGLSVVTRLQHTSGEFIEGTVRMPLEKPTPQAAGSALSYGRRYGLEAILGLTGTEDDDANGAEVHALNGPAAKAQPPAPAARPAPDPKDPPCPKCAGKMWDNRVGKKNPKAPDYKCRDKACDGVIWPPKDGARPAPEPVPDGLDEMPAALQGSNDDGLPF